MLQGAKVDSIMQAGEMVPTELVLDLLINAMDDSGMTRFLVDGFPRTLDQLKLFEEKVRHVVVEEQVCCGAAGMSGCCVHTLLCAHTALCSQFPAQQA